LLRNPIIYNRQCTAKTQKENVHLSENEFENVRNVPEKIENIVFSWPSSLYLFLASGKPVK